MPPESAIPDEQRDAKTHVTLLFTLQLHIQSQANQTVLCLCWQSAKSAPPDTANTYIPTGTCSYAAYCDSLEHL